MLLFSTVTGIFLSLILLSFTARKYTSAIYLSVFFFLVSLYSFMLHAQVYSKSVFLVSVVFLNIAFLSYLIGPLLYWYIRGVLTDNSRLTKKDLWHFLPMLIFLIASLPYIFSPYSYKVEIATKIVEDLRYLGIYKANILYEIFPIAAMYLIRPFLILGYTIWCIVLFIRYLMQRRELLVLSRQSFMIKWLPFLLGFLPLGVVSHFLLLTAAFTREDPNVFYSLNVLRILSEVGLTGLLISPFFFPRVLYGLPRLPEAILASDPEVGETVIYPEKKTRKTPHYENIYLFTIQQKTDTYMKDFRPYLQPNFNMTQLSVIIKIPEHHLAYYFREIKNQTFNDYRNEWRISHAKTLIREGEAARLTLEAIGLLSGFPSRNAFFNAFKKSEGISPGVFAASSK